MISIGILLLLAVITLVVVLVLLGTMQGTRHRLAAPVQRIIIKHWQQALMLPDANRAVLEFDKILAQTLTAAGYDGSVGDQLKAAGDALPQLEEIWWAHKLRNTAAHEPGYTVTAAERKRATRAFYRVIQSFVPSLPK